MIDVYESATDETGRFGAVFERDNETAFFYLLDMREQNGGRIISAFNAKLVTEIPADAPVSIGWNPSGVVVGLFVSGKLSAVFDLRTDTPTGRWANGEDAHLFRMQ